MSVGEIEATIQAENTIDGEIGAEAIRYIEGTKIVKAVNKKQPDENGHLQLEATDIGAVKTVNGEIPDSNGNITVRTGSVSSVNGNLPDKDGNVKIGIGAKIEDSGYDLNSTWSSKHLEEVRTKKLREEIEAVVFKVEDEKDIHLKVPDKTFLKTNNIIRIKNFTLGSITLNNNFGLNIYLYVDGNDNFYTRYYVPKNNLSSLIDFPIMDSNNLMYLGFYLGENNEYYATYDKIRDYSQDISGKQDKATAVTHTASTAVGSETKGVYVSADGVATLMKYSVNKEVPSDAVFTDTKYSKATTKSEGLISKLSGNAEQFLNGKGEWVTPAGTPSEYQQKITKGTEVLIPYAGGYLHEDSEGGYIDFLLSCANNNNALSTRMYKFGVTTSAYAGTYQDISLKANTKYKFSACVKVVSGTVTNIGFNITNSSASSSGIGSAKELTITDGKISYEFTTGSDLTNFKRCYLYNGKTNQTTSRQVLLYNMILKEI